MVTGLANKTIGFKEISQSFQSIVVDSCAMFYPFGAGCDKRLRRNKLEVSSMSLNYWADLIEDSGDEINIYVTLEGLTQLRKKKFFRGSYKKIIKDLNRTSKKRTKGENINAVNLARKIRDKSQARIRLVSLIETNDLTLSLDDSEESLFRHFYENDRELMKKYELRKDEFRLLLSAAVVSQTRKGTTAIITLDEPLLYAWRDFIHREPIRAEEFSAFLREDEDRYGRMKIGSV